MKPILLIKYPSHIKLPEEAKRDMDERLRNNPLTGDYHVLVIADTDPLIKTVTAEIIYNPNHKT